MFGSCQKACHLKILSLYLITFLLRMVEMKTLSYVKKWKAWKKNVIIIQYGWD